MDSQMYPGWVTVVNRQIAKDGLTLCADKCSIECKKRHIENRICAMNAITMYNFDDLK